MIERVRSSGQTGLVPGCGTFSAPLFREDAITHRLARHIVIAAAIAGTSAWASIASASEGSPKDARPVLVLLSIKAGANFSKEKLDSVESLLLNALDATGRFRVIGRGDMRTMLDLEHKRQVAGCQATDACMVAIAGALGADYVASADIGRLGRRTVLSLKVLADRTASSLVHAQQTVTDEDDLPEAAEKIAAQIVAALPASANPAPEKATSMVNPAANRASGPPNPLPASALAAGPQKSPNGSAAELGHTLGIVAAIVGGVGLAVGTGLGVAAKLQTASAKSGPPAPVQAGIDSINGKVTGAIVGWAGGGVFAAAGAGLLVVF